MRVKYNTPFKKLSQALIMSCLMLGCLFTFIDPISAQTEITPSSLLMSGLEKVKKRDYKGAIEDYSQSLLRDPSYDKAYYNRGLAYLEIGELKAAVADFTQVIQIKPSSKAYYHRGRTQVLLADLQSALSDFSQAIQLDPTDAKAYKNRAQVKAELGDKPGAMADYEKAISLFTEQKQPAEVEKITEKLQKLQ
jgi:tetratricopeptide (TPR) repeat protein